MNEKTFFIILAVLFVVSLVGAYFLTGGSYYMTVAIVATIVLIFILTFLGTMIRAGRYTGQWPPVIDKCPDFWQDTSGNQMILDAAGNPLPSSVDPDSKMCYSVNGLNDTNGIGVAGVNFGDAKYNGVSGNQEKKKWAAANNVSWDGITNV